MPYNPNIPLATDQISDSQNDILQNFQSINTLVNVNHVGFDVPDQGKHFFVEMPQQAAASVTALGEVGLQCLASAYNTNGPELVYLPENAGTRVELTAGRSAAVGWSFYPSGVLVKWGQFPVAVLGAGTFLFSLLNAPPAFGAIYNIAFTIQSTNANPDPNIFVNLNVTTTTTALIGFNVVARDTNIAPILPTNVFYTAIGRI